MSFLCQLPEVPPITKHSSQPCCLLSEAIPTLCSLKSTTMDPVLVEHGKDP